MGENLRVIRDQNVMLSERCAEFELQLAQITGLRNAQSGAVPSTSSSTTALRAPSAERTHVLTPRSSEMTANAMAYGVSAKDAGGAMPPHQSQTCGLKSSARNRSLPNLRTCEADGKQGPPSRPASAPSSRRRATGAAACAGSANNAAPMTPSRRYLPSCAGDEKEQLPTWVFSTPTEVGVPAMPCTSTAFDCNRFGDVTFTPAEAGVYSGAFSSRPLASGQLELSDMEDDFVNYRGAEPDIEDVVLGSDGGIDGSPTAFSTERGRSAFTAGADSYRRRRQRKRRRRRRH